MVHLDTFACGELLGVPLTRYVHLRRTTRCPTYSIRLLPVNYPVFHIFEMRLLDLVLLNLRNTLLPTADGDLTPSLYFSLGTWIPAKPSSVTTFAGMTLVLSLRHSCGGRNPALLVLVLIFS